MWRILTEGVTAGKLEGVEGEGYWGRGQILEGVWRITTSMRELELVSQEVERGRGTWDWCGIRYWRESTCCWGLSTIGVQTESDEVKLVIKCSTEKV